MATTGRGESDTARADPAIQLALDYAKQALAAPPQARDALWANAERACTAFIEARPEHPRRVLVEVQRALVAFARGEQARQSHDIAQAIEQLRVAARRFNEIATAVDRELIETRLRQRGDRSADALSVEELESLEANVSYQLARTQHQLALCYPSSSPDRDDALLQAVQRLTRLSRRTPPDDLTWNARIELAACLRALGQGDSAAKLCSEWLRENPPLTVGQRLAAGAADPVPQPGTKNIGAPNGDAFDAAMRAAAAERDAGRYAAAADQYRRAALDDPHHARADEAHQLAVLCSADSLRASPPAERAALVESYERLLREHLAQWPTQESAAKVRLWLGQLQAGRREWSAAVEVLQQVEPKSDVLSDSVPLLVRCYEEQMRPLGWRGEQEQQRRAQLLAAATSYLQPMITGADNRWPDPWNRMQLDTAAALARLHLRFSPQGAPYAEQLLTAALRGRAAEPASEESHAWEATANALLVEALARNGKAAEAHAVADQMSDVPIEVLVETLATLDNLLTGDSPTASDDRELGELALSMLQKLDAHRAEWNATEQARAGTWRAAALAAAGDRAAALAQYAALAAQWPNDGEIQERFAALLAASDAAPDLRQSLERWQKVESRSRRGGLRWQRARQARIDLLTRLGEQAEAEKLDRLTRLLYPDWGTAATSR